MSLPGSDNISSYDFENIESVDTVRYNGENVSFLEGLDRRFEPVYHIIDEFSDIRSKRDFQTISKEKRDRLNQYAEEFNQNVDEDVFEVDIIDSDRGLICFEAVRINEHDARTTNTPNSSVGLVSPENEILGLKVARDYNDIEHLVQDYPRDVEPVPESWKNESPTWSDPRPSQEYLLQETEFLAAMESIESQLRKIEPYVGLIPDNFRYVEENKDPAFEKSDRDVAMLYEWSEKSSIQTEQEAELRGRYVGTLDKLGLYRGDREEDEILQDGSGKIFEVDRERIIYSMNPNHNFYELITHMTPSREEVDDPRYLEDVAEGAYRDVISTDEDMSTLIAENLSEWCPKNLPEERFLDWYWDNPAEKSVPLL